MFLLIIVLLAALIYYIQDKIYFKYWDKNLDIKLYFSTTKIIEGDNAQLIEVIRNAKIMPLPTIHLKFIASKNLNFINENNSITTDFYYRNDVYSILGNKQIKRKLDFIATKRGYYTIDKVDIIANNIFLSNNFINSIKNPSYLYVFPRKLANKDIPIPVDKIIGDYVNKQSLYEDPFQFKGLREYQPYDNISNINWKVSAKSNTLMINEHSTTSSLSINLILNCTLPNFSIEKLGEFSIRLMSTLCEKFCNYGINISFHCNAYDIDNTNLISVPMGTGNTVNTKINEALAKINLYNKTTDFADLLSSTANNNSLKIIVSADYRDELIRIYDSFKNKINVIWIIPKDLDNKKVDIVNNKDIFLWEV